MQKASELASADAVLGASEWLLVRQFLRLLPVGPLLALMACAGDPVVRSDALAAAAGASRTEVAGAGFVHVVYSRGLDAAGSELHIYIGGDGRAFLSRHRVSPDPTPQRPLTLQLMLADPAAAAYVGRPCYHGARADDHCTPQHWTSARYAPVVIDSMAAVVVALAEGMPAARVTLIGYSGGGVVALLVAAQVPQVDRVLTLAAPLDLQAWAEAHDYTPLFESIDPASRSTWPRALQQVHVHGGRDRNVAPQMVSRFRAGLAHDGAPATFEVLDDFDHTCCWLQHWPGLLDDLLTRAKPSVTR